MTEKNRLIQREILLKILQIQKKIGLMTMTMSLIVEKCQSELRQIVYIRRHIY